MRDEESIRSALMRYTSRSKLVLELSVCRGGDIHRSYKVKTDSPVDGHDCLFVKVNNLNNAKVLNSEYTSLSKFAEFKNLSYPKPLLFGNDKSNCYLFMSHHDLSPIAGQDDWAKQLGRGLAKQHKITSMVFGWPQDNFIGLTRQQNTYGANWVDFFAEQRLAPQLSLAKRNGLDPALCVQVMTVINGLQSWFLDYQPTPSLLHGDLWSGNVAYERRLQQAILFDPAPYYGDREADIAMSELFGGFPASFYQAYQQLWPLHCHYRVRKPIYNLYHALNHFNLFGQAYTDLVHSQLAEIN